MYWNVKEMNKEWKKLNVPKKYERMRCDFSVLESHDITMNLSIREDSGKTTQALLYALLFYKLYNFRSVYLRSDNNQITRANIDGLFSTITECNYISILFDDKYNNIYYDWSNHRFYLCKIYTDEDGTQVVEKSNDIFMYVCCNENYMKYKSSGFTDPRLNFMIFDEFMDSERSTSRQMIEFMNNISTFGRPKTRTYTNEHAEVVPIFRCLMLGNNTNLYSFWFSEFCIEEDINNLKFGSYIDKRTNMGTTFACHLISTSNELKDTVKMKKVHFFGFDTPKMNAFNGLQEWQSDVSQHILYDNQINDSNKLNWLYIWHRNKYCAIELYNHKEIGHFLYIHYVNPPRFKDKVILTLTPQEINHVYGFGEYHPNVDLSGIIACFKSNLVYYASNSVGEFVRNYIKEYKNNKLF